MEHDSHTGSVRRRYLRAWYGDRLERGRAVSPLALSRKSRSRRVCADVRIGFGPAVTLYRHGWLGLARVVPLPGRPRSVRFRAVVAPALVLYRLFLPFFVELASAPAVAAPTH